MCELIHFHFYFYSSQIKKKSAIAGNDNNSCSSSPEDTNEGESNGRTQYVSATCIVVTHYSGDVTAVVDEHFTRALSFSDKNSKGKWRPLFISSSSLPKRVATILI